MDGETGSDRPPTTEEQARFENLFGVSERELVEQGVDVDRYVYEHIDEAWGRLHPVDRLRRRLISRQLWVLGTWVVLGLALVIIQRVLLHPRGSAALFTLLLVALTVGAAALLVRPWLAFREAGRQEALLEWKAESADVPLLSSAHQPEAHSQAGQSHAAYSSAGARISRGVTRFSSSTIGSVKIVGNRLRLEGSGELLAEAKVTSVTVHDVTIWFGLGVRLDFADEGRWYVRPLHDRLSPADARRETGRFRVALTRAQGGARLGL